MCVRDLEEALEMGVDWSLREGYAWAEDKEHCEEYCRMLQADPNKVSSKAKKRGLPQVSQQPRGSHLMYTCGCLLAVYSAFKTTSTSANVELICVRYIYMYESVSVQRVVLTSCVCLCVEAGDSGSWKPLR